MDIKCRKCGEPWDADTIHEEVSVRWTADHWSIDGVHHQEKYETFYDEVKKDFYKNGCNAFYGARCNADTIGDENAAIIGVLYDEFGHDLDGVASEIEDFGL